MENHGFSFCPGLPGSEILFFRNVDFLKCCRKIGVLENLVNGNSYFAIFGKSVSWIIGKSVFQYRENLSMQENLYLENRKNQSLTGKSCF